MAVTLHGRDWGRPDGTFVPTTPEDRPCFARWAKLATELFAKGRVKPLEVENTGSLEDMGSALDKLMRSENKEKLVITVS